LKKKMPRCLQVGAISVNNSSKAKADKKKRKETGKLKSKGADVAHPSRKRREFEAAETELDCQTGSPSETVSPWVDQKRVL
jgi:hypothetical protein